MSIPNARVNKPAKGERLEISVLGEKGAPIRQTALTEEKTRARGQVKASFQNIRSRFCVPTDMSRPQIEEGGILG